MLKVDEAYLEVAIKKAFAAMRIKGLVANDKYGLKLRLQEEAGRRGFVKGKHKFVVKEKKDGSGTIKYVRTKGKDSVRTKPKKIKTSVRTKKKPTKLVRTKVKKAKTDVRTKGKLRTRLDLRLPPKLIAKLTSYATKTEQTKTSVVELALKAYLKKDEG